MTPDSNFKFWHQTFRHPISKMDGVIGAGQLSPADSIWAN